MANQQISPCLPDDIIFKNILPCLPSKSLGQFKSVCKKWYHEISQFSHQGWVFVKDRHLAFFTMLQDQIHTLDPFLGFVSEPVISLCGSTNGLICLRLQKCLYVCNPVTRQGDRIPDSASKQFVGLIFEPSISPDRYKIVCAIKDLERQVTFQLYVFSSCNKRWVKSDKKVTVPAFSRHHPKSVSVKGIAYWTWKDYLLWFDCDNDLAGYIYFPPNLVWYDEQDIGIWEERVSCIRVASGTMKIWALASIDSNGGKWETMYQVSLPALPSLIENAPHLLPKHLVGNRSCIYPLPFGGGKKVFLIVMPKWDEEGEESILSLDLETEQVNEVFKGQLLGLSCPYGYDNSFLLSLRNR